MPTRLPSRYPRPTRLSDRPAKLQARFWLLCVTSVSILVTAWLCTLGALPAILALVVEKHVLVALLIMRLDLDKADAAPAESTP